MSCCRHWSLFYRYKFLNVFDSIPTREPMSGDFDCQIPNSIITHGKYPIRRIMQLLCCDIFLKKQKNIWRYGKEEEKTPLSSERDHSVAPGQCRWAVPRCAAMSCAALRDKNCLCKLNLQQLSNFTFDRDNDSCQATKMQLPLRENVSI